MLARFHILLPYSLTLPEGEVFNIYEYQEDGYAIRVFPPVKSDRLKSLDAPDELKLDDKLAFEADALRIDFVKNSFDRKLNGDLDPPEALVARALKSFHVRLRYVTRAYHAKPPNFPLCSWRLVYLNDDESELRHEEGLLRGKGGIGFNWSLIGVNQAVWDNVFGISPDFIQPVWDELRLDAIAAFPNIGAAVVLAATSLEVFISHLLDQMARQGKAPEELWRWINDRDWLREPSVEEQFDKLLKFFTGHSLKEETLLWEAFRNLKSARNTFVHEGIPRVGSVSLSLDDAMRLVQRTNEIVAKVREWLPDELRWVEFDTKFQLTIGKTLVRAEAQKGDKQNFDAAAADDGGVTSVAKVADDQGLEANK